MRPTILGLAFAAALLIALPIVSSSQGTPPPGGPPSGPPGAPPSGPPPGGPGGPGAPGGPPPGGPGGMPPRTPAQMASMRDTVTNMMLARIAGKENAPAESVFKNVQVMKGIPAGRFLRIMNVGFGQSLGVGCGFCHVMGGKWDADDKKEKKIAREMWKMTGTINDDLLAKIPNLDEDNRSINCTTCHRGDRTPATSMPAPVPAH